jgi:hypothetical protein
MIPSAWNTNRTLDESVVLCPILFAWFTKRVGRQRGRCATLEFDFVRALQAQVLRLLAAAHRGDPLRMTPR